MFHCGFFFYISCSAQSFLNEPGLETKSSLVNCFSFTQFLTRNCPMSWRHTIRDNKNPMPPFRSALYFPIRINNIIWGYGLTQFEIWLLNRISSLQRENETHDGWRRNPSELEKIDFFNGQAFNGRIDPQIPNSTGSLSRVQKSFMVSSEFFILTPVMQASSLF